jgi:importin-5
MEMNGQQIGIKTSIIEEKCQAFEMLVLHVSTMNEKFAPWLHPTLEQVLPNLRFFFHDGVREACALWVPFRAFYKVSIESVQLDSYAYVLC